MIHKICTLAAICVLPVMGMQTAKAENLIGHQAVLRALDKVTATTKDFTVPVGEVLQYGSLRIHVRHCEKRPPEETPETFVFVQIENDDQTAPIDTNVDTNVDRDKLDGQESTPKLFSGWMFASSPALSSLDHAVYDIWAIDCIVPAPIPELIEGDATGGIKSNQN